MPRSATPPPPFPLYLIPNLALPFRRRRSSALSTSSTTSTPASSSPPTQPSSYLSSTPTSHLRCQRCLTDLVPIASIISKGFTGRHGRAYLVAPPASSSVRGGTADSGMLIGDLPNTHTHKPASRQLVTGAHTVSDISCRQCGSVLGWKYVDAEEEPQKYKVGKYILETRRVVRGAGWDDEVDVDEEGFERGMVGTAVNGDVEFDSQDEDECEDLFSGIWTPKLAMKRRRNRGFGKEE